MSEINPILSWIRSRPPKRRRTLHRVYAVLRLLARSNKPQTIYMIHKNLIDGTTATELEAIGSVIGAGIGKPAFAQVLRLVKELDRQGFVVSEEGKRNARYTDLTFKGLTYGAASGYVAREDTIHYLARKSPLYAILRKLWPKSETRLANEVEDLVLKSFRMVPVLGLESLGENMWGSFEEGYIEAVEDGVLSLIFGIRRKAPIDPEDLKKLSPAERKTLESALGKYINRMKVVADLCKAAEELYVEIRPSR